MKLGVKRRYFQWVLSLLSLGSAWAVDNPLPASLDGALVRHNGSYFGMADATNGLMLASDNLMDWRSAGSVIEQAVSGPFELMQHNGRFYLHVQDRGSLVASDPSGPFASAEKRALQGEDVRLFQDPSGSLLAFSRQDGNRNGGEIWMQPLAAPWTARDDGQSLISGRRGMWDSLDQTGLGAPDITAYRGNYYLLYAANHAQPRTGWRGIGVAMAKQPQEFTNAGKRADPVLMRNAERLARTYAPILPTGEYIGWPARYSLKPPSTGWARPDAQVAGWRMGKGGFGAPDQEEQVRIQACRTRWTSGNLWIRRKFSLGDDMPQTPVLNLRHEGAVQVFLNGRLILESTNAIPAYANFDISKTSAGLFRKGNNVLAVHAVANRGNEFRFIDFGLSDAGNHPVEPTVYGLDNPRIVEGPNGFEKWLTYHAYWNDRPGSGLDRVFFFGEEMVVDGPTTESTPGYHPPPARPTFFDGFDADVVAWQSDSDEWIATNSMFLLRRAGGREFAVLQQPPATHYLFETHIRLPENGKGTAGIVAFDNGKQQLLIGIDPSRNSWEYRRLPDGRTSKKFKLPPGFKWVRNPPDFEDRAAPFHRLRVVKNGGYFDVMLDDFKLTSARPIITDLTGAGVPGLYGDQAETGFDGVTYTAGWDEYDVHITGWGSAEDGSSAGGEWQHRKDYGLEQTRAEGVGRAFKGDLLDQYEFTVNARVDTLAGPGKRYGVFPVYTGRKNYLKAEIDTHGRKLVVSGRLDGRRVGPYEKSLARRIPQWHLYDKETSYLDVSAWIYALRSTSVVSGFDIRWMDGRNAFLQQEFSVPAENPIVRFASIGRGRNAVDSGFSTADQPKPATQHPGVLNHIDFRPVTGNYIGFGFYEFAASLAPLVQPGAAEPGAPAGLGEISIYNAVGPFGDLSRPLETLVCAEVESSYFFRCVKLKDRVVIELNGQPMMEVEGRWPASQVGLLTEGQPCSFNGMTLMHLPD